MVTASGGLPDSAAVVAALAANPAQQAQQVTCDSLDKPTARSTCSPPASGPGSSPRPRP